MAKQSEFYHTFKRLRPSDGTAWDTEKERVLEQAWWEAMVRADEMLEAAEFEQRVAVKLAKVISNLVKEEPWPDIEVQATTPDLVLKWVRLSVEEEMDENS